MPRNPFVVPGVGVASPFSMAEFVLGRAIDWKRSNPREEIQYALQMRLEDLLHAGNGASWIHAPVDAPVPLRFLLKSVRTVRRQAWTHRSRAEVGCWLRAPEVSQVDGARWHEVMQGSAQDCALIATLVALAWVQTPMAGLTQIIDGPRDLVTNIYPSGKRVQTTLAVPGFSSDALELRFASSTQRGEAWPSLWEKAWLLLEGEDEDEDYRYPNYRRLNNIAPDKALQAHVTHKVESQPFDDGSAWEFLNSLHLNGRLASAAVAWTHANLGSYRETHIPLITENHAYAVLGIQPIDGEDLLIVSDPFKRTWGEIGSTELERARTLLDHTPWKRVMDDCGGTFAVPKEVAHRVFHGVCSYRLP